MRWSMQIGSAHGTSRGAAGGAHARARRHPLARAARGADPRARALARARRAAQPEFAGDEAFLFAPRRRPGAPLVVLAGHYDTVPAQGNIPGRIEDGAVHGLGATRHEGRRRGGARARPRPRRRAPAAVRRRARCSSARRSCRTSTTRSRRCSSGSRSCTRRRSRSCSSRPTARSTRGCLGNMNARTHASTASSGHSARPWLADNAIDRAIDGLAPIAALEPREAVVGGLTLLRGRRPSRGSRPVSPTTWSPTAPSRTSTSATRPTAPRPTPPPTCAHSSRRRRRPRDRRRRAAGAVATSTTARRRAARRGRPRHRAEAGVDERGRLHAPAAFDAVNFGPGSPATPTAATSTSRIEALVHAYETLAPS